VNFNVFDVCEGLKYHRIASDVAMFGTKQSSKLLVSVMNLAEMYYTELLYSWIIWNYVLEFHFHDLTNLKLYTHLFISIICT